MQPPLEVRVQSRPAEVQPELQVLVAVAEPAVLAPLLMAVEVAEADLQIAVEVQPIVVLAALA
jgi:hypothetical protein